MVRSASRRASSPAPRKKRSSQQSGRRPPSVSGDGPAADGSHTPIAASMSRARNSMKVSANRRLFSPPRTGGGEMTMQEPWRDRLICVEVTIVTSSEPKAESRTI